MNWDLDVIMTNALLCFVLLLFAGGLAFVVYFLMHITREHTPNLPDDYDTSSLSQQSWAYATVIDLLEDEPDDARTLTHMVRFAWDNGGTAICPMPLDDYRRLCTGQRGILTLRDGHIAGFGDAPALLETPLPEFCTDDYDEEVDNASFDVYLPPELFDYDNPPDLNALYRECGEMFEQGPLPARALCSRDETDDILYYPALRLLALSGAPQWMFVLESLHQLYEDAFRVACQRLLLQQEDTPREAARTEQDRIEGNLFSLTVTIRELLPRRFELDAKLIINQEE